MLSLHHSDQDREELEEIIWIMSRVSAFVQRACFHLIKVDLCLLDGVLHVRYSLPMIIVNGLIWKINLLFVELVS